MQSMLLFTRFLADHSALATTSLTLLLLAYVTFPSLGYLFVSITLPALSAFERMGQRARDSVCQLYGVQVPSPRLWSHHS